VQSGIILAETRRGMRVLETSHPPVYYIPSENVRMDLLRPSETRHSFCEFKGVATYWTLAIPAAGGEGVIEDVAWSYPEPARGFEPLRDFLAFYASRVDECTVDGERVRAQAGDFYGGWITSRVSGPFKGAPGTRGW
jgi:uncharacterized protein (DUF427 family)